MTGTADGYWLPWDCAPPVRFPSAHWCDMAKHGICRAENLQKMLRKFDTTGGVLHCVCSGMSPKPCGLLKVRLSPLCNHLQTQKLREEIITCFGLCHSPGVPRASKSPNYVGKGLCCQWYIFKFTCRAP